MVFIVRFVNLQIEHAGLLVEAFLHVDCTGDYKDFLELYEG